MEEKWTKRHHESRSKKIRVIEFPNSIAQGWLCWLSPAHKEEFWHDRASKENSYDRRLRFCPLNQSFLGSHAHHLRLGKQQRILCPHCKRRCTHTTSTLPRNHRAWTQLMPWLLIFGLIRTLWRLLWTRTLQQ